MAAKSYSSGTLLSTLNQRRLRAGSEEGFPLARGGDLRPVPHGTRARTGLEYTADDMIRSGRCARASLGMEDDGPSGLPAVSSRPLDVGASERRRRGWRMPSR